MKSKIKLICELSRLTLEGDANTVFMEFMNRRPTISS